MLHKQCPPLDTWARPTRHFTHCARRFISTRNQSPDGKAVLLRPYYIINVLNEAPKNSLGVPDHMTQTANIRSLHSLAAILSPSAPPAVSAGVTRSPTPKRTHTEAFPCGEQQPYLHPASPSQQRANSTYTALSSSPSRTDDAVSQVMTGGQEDRKPQKMVRSSIACVRCRRYAWPFTQILWGANSNHIL